MPKFVKILFYLYFLVLVTCDSDFHMFNAHRKQCFDIEGLCPKLFLETLPSNTSLCSCDSDCPKNLQCCQLSKSNDYDITHLIAVRVCQPITKIDKSESDKIDDILRAVKYLSAHTSGSKHVDNQEQIEDEPKKHGVEHHIHFNIIRNIIIKNLNIYNGAPPKTTETTLPPPRNKQVDSDSFIWKQEIQTQNPPETLTQSCGYDDEDCYLYGSESGSGSGSGLGPNPDFEPSSGFGGIESYPNDEEGSKNDQLESPRVYKTLDGTELLFFDDLGDNLEASDPILEWPLYEDETIEF